MSIDKLHEVLPDVLLKQHQPMPLIFAFIYNFVWVCKIECKGTTIGEGEGH